MKSVRNNNRWVLAKRFVLCFNAHSLSDDIKINLINYV